MTDMTTGDAEQTNGEVWLTSKEAAELLPNVSRCSVQAWAASGKIDGVVRLPSGRYRIPKSSLEELLNGIPPQE